MRQRPFLQLSAREGQKKTHTGLLDVSRVCFGYNEDGSLCVYYTAAYRKSQRFLHFRA